MFIKRNPFVNVDAFNKMLSEVQDGLRDVPSTVAQIAGATKFPFADIFKNEDDTLYIKLAVAGFSREDLDIELENDILTVKGTIQNKDLDDKTYYQKQIARRDFVQKFTVAPQYVNSKNINASTKDGILTISISISETSKPKVLQISID